MLDPKINNADTLLTLSSQTPVTPLHKQISVSTNAVAIFAYNLDKGDSVHPMLILAPPEELCVGRYPMRPIICGCSNDLYFKEDNSVNNVIVLDVPGRYDLYYSGTRQDDLVLIKRILSREADSASLIKSCC